MEPVGDPSTPMPRKASEWLLALREQPDDPALRRRFDAWLAESPSHAVDWKEMSHTVSALDELQRVRWRPATHPFARLHPPRRRVWVAMLGAVAAIMAILMLPAVALRLEADYLTGTAEQKSVALPDGSLVQLAPDSAMVVQFDEARRQVRLLRGEALFTVQHLADRPFVVAAAHMKVIDLGTAFDVRVATDRVEVAVKEGVVQVESGRAERPVSERLQAGDWIVAADPKPIERGRRPVEEIGAWTGHRLAIKNRPVSEIVAALRPYFRGIILLHGDEWAEQRLTGYYDLSNPTDALRAVAGAQGGSIYWFSPWIVVLTGK